MKYIINFPSTTSLTGIVYFFSLAFIYVSNINILNPLNVFCLILVFIAFLILFIKLIGKRKNLFKIIKEIKFELLIFFLFFLLYFIYANINIFELNKQSCQNLPVFVCKNWSTIYFIYFFSFFLIFKEFKDINFSKIIINTGVIFSIIGLIYFFYLILYSQFDIQKYYYFTDKLGVGPEMIRIFPHFSVTYTESSRNYEIFPILIAKLFIIYEMIKSENKKISFKDLLIFSLLSVFIFYSYSRLIWIMDGAIFLSLIILYNNKFKILKLYTLNVFIILILMSSFTYIYNFSKILNWETNQNIRTNITYYTLGRVSTLFSDNLTNYFNKKNNSNEQRKLIYTEGINKFIEKPFGYGVMSAPVRGSNAESGILQVALEVGIFGLILFLIILFYPMILILKSKNTMNLTLFTFCIVIFISQIFTVYLWYNFLWFYLGLIFGLIKR